LNIIQFDHRCAFCDAAIRNKIHKVNSHTQKQAMAQPLSGMLQKIKASTKTATSNIDFFFRYNHFYGVSYAFFSYDGGLAIYQACRVRQTYGSNKKPEKS
jgi:hypothetical protein